MNLKQLIADDDAVSPVIGVILMVAVTVILAAVIGGTVVGMGNEPATTPQASFSFDVGDYDGDSVANDVNVTHDGGDTIPASQITVKTTAGTAVDPSGNLTAGDGWMAAKDLPKGETVRIVWQNPENKESSVLADFTR